MIKLLLFALFVFRACVPATPYLSPEYARQLHSAMAWLVRCDASKFGAVVQNVNAVIVVPQATLKKSLALAQPGGAVFVSASAFDSAYEYFPQTKWAKYVAALIVHEARHEWQMKQTNYDAWAIERNERDARLFAESVYACR